MLLKIINQIKQIKNPTYLSMIPSLQQLGYRQTKNKISLQNTHYINYYETGAYRQYRPNWAKK
jgi:hypothetical protein|tara:strand:+ start:353 stop:541 length:189 start_codon:yes stop_codon:yes gene_type:complete